MNLVSRVLLYLRNKQQFIRQINVFTKKLISRKFLSVIAFSAVLQHVVESTQNFVKLSSNYKNYFVNCFHEILFKLNSHFSSQVTIICISTLIFQWRLFSRNFYMSKFSNKQQ